MIRWPQKLTYFIHHDLFDRIKNEYSLKEYQSAKGYREEHNQYRSTEKQIFDITIGKAAEVALYCLLADDNTVTPPSFKPWSKGEYKGFQPDLTANGYPISVKTCFNCSNPSWVFNKKDPVVHSEGDYWLGLTTYEQLISRTATGIKVIGYNFTIEHLVPSESHMYQRPVKDSVAAYGMAVYSNYLMGLKTEFGFVR
jgi:hypothetical protein